MVRILLRLLSMFIVYLACGTNTAAINQVDLEECALRYLKQETELKEINCVACDSCVAYLISYLNVIEDDFKYANKTIDRDKLEYKIKMRLDELELPINEHYMGFKSSEEMLYRATNTIKKHFTDRERNSSIDDSIQLLMENLEQEANSMFDRLKDTWPLDESVAERIVGLSRDGVYIDEKNDQNTTIGDLLMQSNASMSVNWMKNSLNLRGSLDELEEDLDQFEESFGNLGKKIVTDGFMLLIAASQKLESSDSYLALLEETKKIRADVSIIGDLSSKLADRSKDFGLDFAQKTN